MSATTIRAPDLFSGVTSLLPDGALRSGSDPRGQTPL
jgi:hypothetical protein